MSYKHLSLILLMLSCGSFAFGSGPQYITYEGYIEDNAGYPVTTSKDFQFEIRDATNTCVLYRETQTITPVQGNFQAKVGTGTPTYQPNTFNQIFVNGITLTADCGTYNGSAGAQRYLVAYIEDGGFQTIGQFPLGSVPNALNAEQVAGYSSSQILRTQAGVTAPELSNAQVTELTDLLTGASANYISSSSPSWSSAPSAGSHLTNKTYVDTAITTQLTSAISNIDGSNITGTIDGSVAINTSGNLVTTGAVSGSELRGSNLKIYNGTNYVQFTAPALGGSDLLFVLPDNSGSSGQVLRTDGAGNLSWVSPSSGSITNVTASAPLSSSGGFTPDISISPASASGSGYLTMSDWNTFNNKLDGAASFGGDISGVYNGISVDRLKGTSLNITTLTSGNYLRYDGTNWSNASISAADIPNLDASKITSGILPTTRGGTGATNFTSNSVIVSNIGGTLESKTCSNGEIIKFGIMGPECATDNGGTGNELLNSGNSFGASVALGTNDNFDLNFKTNGTNKMTLTTSGFLGIGTTSPDSSAALHIEAAGRGLLIPRMTAAARNAIGTPATGLQVYNTTSNELNYYDGSSWKALGVAGAGITSFNGSSQGTQALAIVTSGTAPAWSTNAGTGVHTLNIPMASNSGVAAGLISKGEYDTFNAKLDSTTGFMGDVAGSYNSMTVTGIQGTPISPSSPSAGDLFMYNGSEYINVQMFGDASLSSSGELFINKTSSNGFFQNGGNSFPGSSALGTNNDASLSLKTSNTVRMTIGDNAKNGNVGIGTIPAGDVRLTVNGDIRTTANGKLILSDSTNGYDVIIRAPTSVASSHTLTLPSNQGAVGTVMVNNGSGSLSWQKMPESGYEFSAQVQVAGGNQTLVGINTAVGNGGSINNYDNSGRPTMEVYTGTAGNLVGFHMASQVHTSWTFAGDFNLSVPPITTGSRYFVGFNSAVPVYGSNTTAPFGSDTYTGANFIGFRISQSSGDSSWKCVSCNNGTCTSTDTGQTPSGTTNYKMRIEMANRSPKFYINGSQVCASISGTTYSPANSTYLSPAITSHKGTGTNHIRFHRMKVFVTD